MSLGTKLRVISLIWVMAWNRPMSRPMISTVSKIGPAMSTVISMACWPMVITDSGVMQDLSGQEAGGERAHDERPAVHQHEQHELERQRDDRRRQHHHAHRHEHARHHEADDQKRE